MRKSTFMKQSQKKPRKKITISEDLDEIPKALGLKSLEKMMTEPPEITTEQALAIAKIAISMIH